MERDGGCCVICGSSVNLDVHHRIAKGSGGTRDSRIAFGMANLVTLCRHDHSRIEVLRDHARRWGMRLDRSQNPETERVWYRGGWVVLDHDGGINTVMVEEGSSG